MAKLYSKKRNSIKEMKPSAATISFILSYSQALKIVKVGKLTFDTLAN